MAKRGRAEGTRPHGVPDEVWAEAVRRAAVVAPLSGEGRLTRARVHDAARELGLSVPRAYRLIALYREVPVTFCKSAGARPGCTDS